MIAIAGPNLPLDLLAATGRYTGPLRFNPECDTPRATQWLESKFAPWAPSVLEAWAGGEYDQLDEVLFSRADDTSQRLYYYVCELQRRGLLAGPRALILDIAKIERPSSLERTIAQVRALASDLGVDDVAFERAIVDANRQRSIMSPQASVPACLLSGTAPPDRRLHNVIAKAGFKPVGLTLAEVWSDLGALVAENSGDPAAAVGQQLHEQTSGPRSFIDPATRLARAIERSSACAVILWRIEEDEAQTWHLPAERQFLEQSGLPSLILTRREWLGEDGVNEEIGKFLEGVAA